MPPAEAAAGHGCNPVLVTARHDGLQPLTRIQWPGYSLPLFSEGASGVGAPGGELVTV